MTNSAMTDEPRDFHGVTAEEAAALARYLAEVSEQQLQAWLEGDRALHAILSRTRTAASDAAALKVLGEASAVCPFAAYALGNVLAERPDDAGWSSAEKAFRRCAELGLPLVEGADEPFNQSSTARRVIRDVIGRAITNIGSHYGNGQHPEQALPYFDRALEIDPGNRVALVSRGNITLMDENHLGRTALDGIDDWRKADENPRFREDFDSWKDGRKNVVSVVHGIRDNYGREAAEKWATCRLPGLMEFRDMTSLSPRVRRAGHLPSVAGISWSATAVEVAEHLHEAGLVEKLVSSPLEFRVTLAGSLLATLSRGTAPTADPDLLDRALSRSEGIEPLNPLLGDHEWQELRPPHTDYLARRETIERVHSHVESLFRSLSAIGVTGGEDMALGVLFHLDARFRAGVTQMMRGAFATSKPGFIYVAALSVG